MYIYGIRQSLGMAKMGAGIYDPDKYMALIGAGITLVLSLILINPFGIIGVMIGNIVGIMVIPYWVQPYLVYDEVFKKDVKIYHYKFALYTFLTAAYAYITYMICDQILKRSGVISSIAGGLESIGVLKIWSCAIAQVIVNSVVCLIIPNVLNAIIFYRTSEFKSLLSSTSAFFKKSGKK
jgi:hypothetical protein